MKTRIIRREKKEFGEVVEIHYILQHYRRFILNGLILICIPVIGLLTFIFYNPFKLQWNNVKSFSSKKELDYYLKGKNRWEIKETIIGIVKE